MVWCRRHQLRGVFLAGLTAAPHVVEAVSVPCVILWLAANLHTGMAEPVAHIRWRLGTQNHPLILCQF